MPTVSFVVLQPTPFCNISCKYCYLPDRGSPARMSLATIERIFSELFSTDWAAEDLYLIWHAGEPLVLPINYYSQAFDCIERLTPKRIKVSHAVQTNGMMIDDAWSQFFNKRGVSVGVSIDGPQDIHDANRVTRSGKPTFAEAIAGVRCLRRNNVNFSVISVLTDVSLGRPADLYDFYQREGISNVCFNVEEVEGLNTSSSLSGEGKQEAYENFIRAFWNLNVNTNALTYVREYKDMIQKILRPAEDVSINNTLATPFEHLNVDWQGNFGTFSPEFLGQCSDKYDDFILGNIWRNSLVESLESETFKKLNSDIAAGVALCRMTCAYFSVCGGGSLVNKFYENGTVISTETLYCRMNIKAVADVSMEVIERTAKADIVPEYPLPEPVAGTPGLSYDPDAARILFFIGNDEDSGERIEIGSACGSLPSTVAPWSYETGAVVPKPHWRRLTETERDRYTTRLPPGNFGRAIAIAPIPLPILRTFASLQLAAKAAKTGTELQPLLDSAEIGRATKALVDHVRTLFQHPHLSEDVESTGITIRPAGLLTVTSDADTHTLIGLHVDDWYAYPIAEREHSPNRVCINLGCESRFLLFVNVGLAQMNAAIKAAGACLPDNAGGTPVARRFMAMFPDTPLLRVRVGPGEAYIAPTENLAHDASTFGMSTFDITLQVRGHFGLMPS